MTLPLATTLITVQRLPGSMVNVDSYDAEPPYTAIAQHVRAHIYAISGLEQVQGGTQEDVRFRLDSDMTDLVHTDRVLDEVTDVVYEVTWARPVTGMGLDHVEGELRVVTGNVY